MRIIRILDDVYLVGSGEMGLSHPLDSHVYLLDDGEAAALVDSGIGLAVERLVGNIDQSGISLDRVRHLLLTHSHVDHARGCRQLQRRLHCRVITSAGEARLLSQGSEFELGLAQAKYAMVYPEELNLRAHSRGSYRGRRGCY